MLVQAGGQHLMKPTDTSCKKSRVEILPLHGNYVHKDYEQNQRQRGALAKSKIHQEWVQPIAGSSCNGDKTLHLPEAMLRFIHWICWKGFFSIDVNICFHLVQFSCVNLQRAVNLRAATAATQVSWSQLAHKQKLLELSIAIIVSCDCFPHAEPLQLILRFPACRIPL